MDYEKFVKKTEGETFEDIVHRSRKRAQEVLEDQGIAAACYFRCFKLWGCNSRNLHSLTDRFQIFNMLRRDYAKDG